MGRTLVSVLCLAAVAVAVNGCDRDDSAAGRKSESTGVEKEVARGSNETGKSGDARIAQADKDSTVGKTQSGRAGSATGAQSIERSRSAVGGQQNIREAQEALKNQGQDPGPIDGIMGPKTRQALRAFQSKHGLKQTGTLDAATKEKLNVESSGSTAGRARKSGSVERGDSSTKR